MALPAGYSSIRFGYIEVGDYIFVPAIGSYIEVEVGSIYLGSSVDSHAIVQRHGRKVSSALVFSNHSERCDHVREHDGVMLCSIGFVFDIMRVVVCKDAKFVYLRSTDLFNSATVNKVCRSTGKVWAWTPTGWDVTTYEMRLEGETGRAADTSAGGLLQKGERVYYGD